MFLISPDPGRTFTTGVFSFGVNQLRDHIEFSASDAGVAHSGSSEVLGGLLIPLRRTMATGLHPEGMSAISRGLSEATPPEEVGQMAVAS